MTRKRDAGVTEFGRKLIMYNSNKTANNGAKLRVTCCRLNGVSSPREARWGGAPRLALSLSNEAPWRRGSRPSLGPHTSLMFPHHSPDNYRGRECHLGGASSTEDDSTRSAVQLDPRVSVLHLTPVRHAHTHTHTQNNSHITQGEPYVSSQQHGRLTSSALFQPTFPGLKKAPTKESVNRKWSYFCICEVP